MAAGDDSSGSMRPPPPLAARSISGKSLSQDGLTTGTPATSQTYSKNTKLGADLGTTLPIRSSGVRPGRGRVALKPGHSPLDWERLRSSTPPPREPPRIITVEELAQHKARDDAWTALGGKVYNITAYLPFHPGGEGELMRVAGRDGTRLFGGIHAWVNYERLLDRWFIGVLARQ